MSLCQQLRLLRWQNSKFPIPKKSEIPEKSEIPKKAEISEILCFEKILKKLFNFFLL